jgi:hypothetical protein
MSFLSPAASDVSPATLSGNEAGPMIEWSAACMQFLIDAQHSPLQAGLTWQQSASTIQKKAWSDWMGRSAGKAATAA